jgi:hypothetical protein
VVGVWVVIAIAIGSLSGKFEAAQERAIRPISR